MDDRALRVGIVGAGRILPAHLGGYRALRDAGLERVEIAALCARRREDIERFLAPGGPLPRPPLTDNPGDPLNAPHVYLSELQPGVEVTGWTNHLEMIERAELDVIDITATVAAHHPATLAAAARGRHVMVQKPLARDVREGLEMVRACGEAGVALGVMENVRWEPSVLMERWLVESGRLGEVQMITAAYLGAHLWSPDRVVADTPWRHRRAEAGGGISVDLGVHFFQRLRLVAGPIARVYGTVRTFEPVRYVRDAGGAQGERVEADVDDTMFCQVEFENGGVAHLSASWAGHGPPTGVTGGIAFYGARGCLQGDRLYLDGEEPTTLREYWERHATPEERESTMPAGIEDSFALTYRDFYRAVREGRKPAYDGREGLIDLALAEAVTLSSERGRPVTADEALSAAAERA